MYLSASSMWPPSKTSRQKSKTRRLFAARRVSPLASSASWSGWGGARLPAQQADRVRRVVAGEHAEDEQGERAAREIRRRHTGRRVDRVELGVAPAQARHEQDGQSNADIRTGGVE